VVGQVVDPETGLLYLQNRYYDPSTAQFISVDPLVGLTHSPYGYVYDNPLNATDPTGLGCGWTSPWDCASSAAGAVASGISGAAGAAANVAGQGLSDVLYQLVPGNPAYINVCGGFAYIVAADVCVQVTHAGHVYVAPGVGFGTPGFIGSVEGGYIHDLPNPCSSTVDNYLHGWTLTGSGGYAAGIGGVWGNEGSFGNNDYGDEIGVSTPGLSLIQSYGFRWP
jgi:RHS repeat-associated protein